MADGLLSRAVPFVARTLFQNVTYTAQRGLHKGMRVHGGLGWVPGGSLTQEDRYLSSLDLRGKIVFDVGGFFGYKTLFFAARAKHVVVSEPNSHNRARLLRNIAENKLTNVTVRPVGLGSTPGTVSASWNHNRPGESSAVYFVGLEQFTFDVTTLDAEVQSLGMIPDFMKVDVEGFEVEVVRGAMATLVAHRPQLIIEMHGAGNVGNLALCREMFPLLRSAGYSELLDVERQRTIGPDPSETFGHIATVGERNKAPLSAAPAVGAAAGSR